MADQGILSIWTVYDHPRDFPDGYVVRRWEVRQGGPVQTDDVLFSPDLDLVQAEMRARGLAKLMRHPADDPVIVECWI